MGARAQLLLHCTVEEAAQVRRRAELEYRGVSAYMLRIVMLTVRLDEKVGPSLRRYRELVISGKWKRIGDNSARTTTLLRCSRKEARMIREAAARRELPISEYVFRALRRSWKAVDRLPEYEF